MNNENFLFLDFALKSHLFLAMSKTVLTLVLIKDVVF